MTKITVAMAAYNHEKFVGEAIESVLTQSGCDFDFSIVDDGSKDGTVNEILKYHDPRIRFTALEKNQGACVALRKAIEGGNGEYVAILNSDDKFLPGKLAKQAKFLDENPEIHAVFGYPQIVDEHGKPLSFGKHFCGDVFKQPNRKRQEWLHYFFYELNALCHPTVMIRRSCYTALGYYDPRLAQLPDFDFWVRLLFKYNIHILPEELIQFRILPGAGNTSAPRKETVNRTFWELRHVFEHYLQISSVDEFLSIFPEERSFIKNDDPDLIPFYLASLAMRIDNPNASVYRQFGLQILFSMLANPVLQNKLERMCGFRYVDFIRYSGSAASVQDSLFYIRLKKITSPKWVFNRLKRMARGYVESLKVKA